MRALPALFLASGLLLSAGAAAAQAPPPPPMSRPALKAGRPPMTPEMQQAKADKRRMCKADMMRLCPGGKGADKNARHECMRAHRKDFSPQCQDATARMKQLRHNSKRG